MSEQQSAVSKPKWLEESGIINANAALEDYLVFLDDLRESGEQNMFDVTRETMLWWAEEYGERIDKYQAREVADYWRKTFAERHNS